MILRAWSGALIDTAAYPWTIWLRWAAGWVRYVWAAWGTDRDGVARCRARTRFGLRCWERLGHRGPHGHERRPGPDYHMTNPRHYRWEEIMPIWPRQERPGPPPDAHAGR